METEMVESVQQASAEFFVPVIAAYLLACVGWLAAERAWPGVRARGEITQPARPGRELILAFAAVAALFGIGQLYNHDWLIPRGSGGWRSVTFNLNTLIIYSPIFAVLAARRQSLDTVFLSAQALPAKVAVGAALGLVATAVYLGLRGELAAYPDILLECVGVRSLGHFLPVFLEGVVLAFLFVRLRWVVGLTWALLIPGVLFAVGHVPRQMESGRSLMEMLAFFALNTTLPMAIMYAVQRSRDIIWIGMVHYIMDVAIRAFD